MGDIMSENIVELIVIATVLYKGAVGFGDVFECHVTNVKSGKLDEEKINLTILASDKDKLKFFSNNLHPVKIEIEFKENKKNEPYGMVPISGFVDKSRTSWEITYFHKVKE